MTALAAGAPATPRAVPRTAGSLGQIVKAELVKLLRRPATWVLLGLWPTLQLVFSLIIPYVSYRRGSSYEGSPPSALLDSITPHRLVLNAISGLPS